MKRRRDASRGEKFVGGHGDGLGFVGRNVRGTWGTGEAAEIGQFTSLRLKPFFLRA